MSGTALVTGGAGFIGSHLVDGLLALGWSVRVLDDFSTGRRENLPDSGIDLIEGSVADADVCRAAVAGVDVVYHEAALASVVRSVEAPLDSHEANVTGTLLLLEAARASGVDRFVFAGSSSIYGDLEELPKREDHPTSPISPYGVSKLAAEAYIRSFGLVYGMRTLTLRYFNVFGPRQMDDSPYSGVIAKFCRAAVLGEGVVIDGDGEQSRDFTPVENVVHGNLLALKADYEPGSVLNLALGVRVSVNELWAGLQRISGSEVEAGHGAERAGDVKHSQADIALAVDVLGFEPVLDFSAGLESTYAWYADNLSP